MNDLDDRWQALPMRDGRTVWARPVRASDSDRFMTFFEGLSAESRDFMHGWSGPGACTAEHAEKLAAKAASEEHCGLIVLATRDSDARMAGYCWIDGVKSGHCLGDLPGLGIGIVDECHGAGLGQALLRLTIDTAWRIGLVRVRLGVFADNPRAIRAYEAVGFREDPEVPPKDFDGRAELYMVVETAKGRSREAGALRNRCITPSP